MFVMVVMVDILCEVYGALNYESRNWVNNSGYMRDPNQFQCPRNPGVMTGHGFVSALVKRAFALSARQHPHICHPKTENCSQIVQPSLSLTPGYHPKCRQKQTLSKTKLRTQRKPAKSSISSTKFPHFLYVPSSSSSKCSPHNTG